MKKTAVILGVIAAVGGCMAAIFCLTVDDPRYRLMEFLSWGGYHRYDIFIVAASERHGIEPELIKAIIWRESRFHPHKVGTQGERGLMQVTEKAAEDWAKAERVATFLPTDLFDPKVNIDAGTWYISRALTHWASKDDPVPFALAEYNAGRGRVIRWVKDSGQGSAANVNDLHGAMDFPNTKSYILAITSRADFYRRHGEFRAYGTPPAGKSSVVRREGAIP